jgi:repressor LexA
VFAVKTTGDRLRELRTSRNLSQAQVAEYLGIKPSTYCKYETDENRPVRKLKELSELFHVPADYIMCLSDNPFVQLLKSDNNSALGRTVMEAETQKLKELLSNEIPVPLDNKKIPIIGRVKCGYDGYVYEYVSGSVMIDSEKFHGDIKAFRCYGDSMKGIGIFDGDIAIVRMQDKVESGELAIVVVNGDEGMLKRVRYEEGKMIMLESANPDYPPRVFTGEDMDSVHVVGKVLETRRSW